MLYGEIKVTFKDDGSTRIDASHCTADCGAAEIQAALEALAQELGGTWKEEKHLIRSMHHSHAHGDHHIHH